MKLKFIAEKYLKTATGKNKLVTDNSIQANHLNIGKYVQETYMKQFHGIEEMTNVRDRVVTLPTEMENTNYNIQLTVENVDVEEASGGAFMPSGNVSAYIKEGTVTTTGFTIRLASLISAGETVKVHWMVTG